MNFVNNLKQKEVGGDFPFIFVQGELCVKMCKMPGISLLQSFRKIEALSLCIFICMCLSGAPSVVVIFYRYHCIIVEFIFHFFRFSVFLM